jgi:lipopolysaccharide/colanic/teichoic acid biosynthesis glycosyltransferase
MIRFFDVVFSFFGLLVLSPFIVVIWLIGFFDTGAPIFAQERVGKNKQPFKLYKFRSMHVNTKSVATHLASQASVTIWGSFLRKSKIDELPQLFNVLKGNMSLVGPRPNLFNQQELIEERDKRGVYKVAPGITGEAQINKIDMSTPKLLAEIDAVMTKNITFKKYIYYIIVTVLGNGSGDRIK